MFERFNTARMRMLPRSMADELERSIRLAAKGEGRFVEIGCKGVDCRVCPFLGGSEGCALSGDCRTVPDFFADYFKMAYSVAKAHAELEAVTNDLH